METGYDILFFWVARMIMMGLEFTGQAPFHTVYLHGIIRDEFGRRMSKTLGNGIDPLTVMDELGTDALRFTLLVGSTPGNDMSLSVKKVEANRNFANKVWNAGRFVINAVSSLTRPADTLSRGERGRGEGDYSLADSWIWARLRILVRDVERLFQTFQYGEAGRQIYEFFWSEFADWYVEIAKGQLAEGGARAFNTARTLAQVLDTCLRLLHPFTPFVTEELWGHLRNALRASPLADLTKDWPAALIVARWPEPRPDEGWEAAKLPVQREYILKAEPSVYAVEGLDVHFKIINDFTLVQEIVRAIRNLRAEKAVPPSKRIPAILVAGAKTDLIKAQVGVLAALAGLDGNQIKIQKTLKTKPEGALALVVGPVEVYLPLSGMVDLQAESARLKRELAEVQSQIERLEKLLGGDFADKAPAAVVDKEREKLAGFKETAKKLKAQLKG